MVDFRLEIGTRTLFGSEAREGSNPNTRRVFPHPSEAGNLQGWRAYYDQGRIFDSSKVSWEDLPEWGVQFVICFFEGGGREIVMGEDEYVLRGSESVKYGLQLSDSEFWTLHEVAVYDEEVPGQAQAGA